MTRAMLKFHLDDRKNGNTVLESAMEAIEKLENHLQGDANTLFALVFGSMAGGRAKPDSDLDLAVYFRRPPEGLEVLRMVNDLSNLAGREIDLVILNRASAFLRHQVMKNGLRLVIRDRSAYIRFREKTMTDYDEYKYISGMGAYDRFSVA